MCNYHLNIQWHLRFVVRLWSCIDQWHENLTIVGLLSQAWLQHRCKWSRLAEFCSADGTPACILHQMWGSLSCTCSVPKHNTQQLIHFHLLIIYTECAKHYTETVDTSTCFHFRNDRIPEATNYIVCCIIWYEYSHLLTVGNQQLDGHAVRQIAYCQCYELQTW